MNHIYLLRLVVLKCPGFQSQNYGMPSDKTLWSSLGRGHAGHSRICSRETTPWLTQQKMQKGIHDDIQFLKHWRLWRVSVFSISLFRNTHKQASNHAIDNKPHSNSIYFVPRTSEITIRFSSQIPWWIRKKKK